MSSASSHHQPNAAVAAPVSLTGTEEMTIMPLGGGQEVGRSCILLSYQQIHILLDCGSHPGREGTQALPFFDSLAEAGLEARDIDLVLITHFHIDHCAALPYFTEKTDFAGKVVMTHATKAVMQLLLSDNIRLQSSKQALYNEQDLQNCLDKISVVDYYSTLTHKGISFTATPAGHVLGAAMFTLDIDNIRVLYTGDYSLEEDRHLSGAQMPPGPPPNVLIVESTFGSTEIAPRKQREEAFTNSVERIVTRGGSCLIPVFALGRAQELLLILDEHWQRNTQLQAVPIYYASKLAVKSLRVYQTFVNMMNRSVRSLSEQFVNPFKFKHISSSSKSSGAGSGALSISDMVGPCVVMASPGFLQNGISREIFELWCDYEKHGVIIPGYTIEGTLADRLKDQPREITCLDNRIKPRRCSIEFFTFAAHVDWRENMSFVQRVTPDYIILVHGEKTQMRRFKDKLEAEMRGGRWPSAHKPAVAMPENGMKVRVPFRKSLQVTVEGELARDLTERVQKEQAMLEDSASQSVSASLPAQAVLVTENFTSKLVSVNELSKYSSCAFGSVREKFVLPLPQDVLSLFADRTDRTVKTEDKSNNNVVFSLLSVVAEHLRQVYDDVVLDTQRSDATQADGVCVRVQQGLLTVQCTPSTNTHAHARTGGVAGLELCWAASPMSDVLADSVAGLLLQFFSASHLVKMTLLAQQQQQQQRQHTTLNSKDKEVPLLRTGREAAKRKRQRDLLKTEEDLAVEQDWEKAGLDPSKQIPVSFRGLSSPQRLSALRDKLLALPASERERVFSEIKLTHDGSRLIFRGKPQTVYSAAKSEEQEKTSCLASIVVSPLSSAEARERESRGEPTTAEAFVFIAFSPADTHAQTEGEGENEGEAETHRAVVHCEDEGFRAAVVAALQALE